MKTNDSSQILHVRAALQLVPSDCPLTMKLYLTRRVSMHQLLVGSYWASRTSSVQGWRYWCGRECEMIRYEPTSKNVAAVKAALVLNLLLPHIMLQYKTWTKALLFSSLGWWKFRCPFLQWQIRKSESESRSALYICRRSAVDLVVCFGLLSCGMTQFWPNFKGNCEAICLTATLLMFDCYTEFSHTTRLMIRIYVQPDDCLEMWASMSRSCKPTLHCCVWWRVRWGVSELPWRWALSWEKSTLILSFDWTLIQKSCGLFRCCFADLSHLSMFRSDRRSFPLQTNQTSLIF